MNSDDYKFILSKMFPEHLRLQSARTELEKIESRYIALLLSGMGIEQPPEIGAPGNAAGAWEEVQTVVDQDFRQNYRRFLETQKDSGWEELRTPYIAAVVQCVDALVDMLAAWDEHYPRALQRYEPSEVAALRRLHGNLDRKKIDARPMVDVFFAKFIGRPEDAEKLCDSQPTVQLATEFTENLLDYLERHLPSTPLYHTAGWATVWMDHEHYNLRSERPRKLLKTLSQRGERGCKKEHIDRLDPLDSAPRTVSEWFEGQTRPLFKRLIKKDEGYYFLNAHPIEIATDLV